MLREGQVCPGRSSPLESWVRLPSIKAGESRRRGLAVAIALGLFGTGVEAAPFSSVPASGSHDAGSIVQRVQDRMITDETTGAKLRLPLGIRKLDEKTYTGGKGQNYSIDNLIVSVLLFDPNNRSLQQMYRHYQNPPRVRNRVIDFGNSWLRSDRFALVGVDAGVSEFSIDMVENAGELRGLSLVISRGNISADGLTRMRRIAAAIRASFEPFPAAPAAVSQIPDIREITAPSAVRVPSAASSPTPARLPSVAAAQLPPASALVPPAPAWSVSRPSEDGFFDQFTGAILTGAVLLESPPGRSYSREECAVACTKVPQCAAYTRFGDGRCVMRSSKGEVKQAPSAGTTSGVRSARAS